MRRKPGTLLPLETSILESAIELSAGGVDSFHGFELAKRLRDDEGGRRLTAHGTLYKALGRLEKAGLLESVWEDPDAATAQGRPRRRLYSITSQGRVVFARVQADARPGSRLNPGLSAP